MITETMTAAKALLVAEKVLGHGVRCVKVSFRSEWDREDLGGKWTTSRQRNWCEDLGDGG